VVMGDDDHDGKFKKELIFTYLISTVLPEVEESIYVDYSEVRRHVGNGLSLLRKLFFYRARTALNVLVDMLIFYVGFFIRVHYFSLIHTHAVPYQLHRSNVVDNAGR
jgi:hypothetical protein